MITEFSAAAAVAAANVKLREQDEFIVELAA